MAQTGLKDQKAPSHQYFLLLRYCLWGLTDHLVHWVPRDHLAQSLL